MCMKRFGTMKACKPALFLRRVSKKARGNHLLTLLMKRRLKRAGVSKEAAAARRRASAGGAAEMERVNLKLYWENRSIMEENERLREKALVLRQENQALRSHLVGQKSVAASLRRS